jgi:hypothetical protein
MPPYYFALFVKILSHPATTIDFICSLIFILDTGNPNPMKAILSHHPMKLGQDVLLILREMNSRSTQLRGTENVCVVPCP